MRQNSEITNPGLKPSHMNKAFIIHIQLHFPWHKLTAQLQKRIIKAVFLDVKHQGSNAFHELLLLSFSFATVKHLELLLRIHAH